MEIAVAGPVDAQSPVDDRILIVNADDLGLSEGINRGVLTAHVEGVVTSASLMVRRPASESASEDARGRAA